MHHAPIKSRSATPVASPVPWWVGAPTAHCARCAEDMPTYVIDREDEIVHPRPQIVIGVPLCGGCDHPTG